MMKEDKEISISNERHQQTLLPRSLLITECGDGMCMGTHDIRDEVHLELNVLNRLEISHKVLPHSLHAVRNQDQRDV